ncbi:MAG TPA: SRPBCC family protein [Mycobacteriales bacterium]|nr:SRPBCC family protein [Mycobacteriales bacterium]
MGVDVTVSTVIARPRDVVATFAADPTNAPVWYRRIASVEWRTSPPVGVGSEMDFVARFMGRRLAYTYVVRELIAGERLVMSTAQGPFPMETTYTWADAGDGTRMSLRNRGNPGGLWRLFAPVMASSVRRATSGDLAELKAQLEAA